MPTAIQRFCNLQFGMLLALLFCLNGVEAFALNSSVTVVITEPSGVQAFGSGVVISPRGEVLTCYHVVEDATAVRVFYLNRFYDAKVFAIAPDRDIAKLRMVGVDLPTEYNEPSISPSTKMLGRNLYIYGFVAGMFDQRIAAQATQEHFVLTEQMKDTQGKRLFDQSGIPVIPLITTVYKGLSGAPVIDGAAVIGILSGSLSQGGSVAWAISVENASDRYMMSVDAPRPNFVWPKLTLMSNGWETLRRQSGVGEAVVQRIESLDPVLHNLENSDRGECNESRNLVQGFDKVQDLLGNGSIDSTLSSDFSRVRGAEIDAEFGRTMNRNAQALKSFNANSDNNLSDYDETRNQYHALEEGTIEYLDSLPDTHRNRELRAAGRKRLLSISASQIELGKKELALQDSLQYDGTKPLRTVGDYRLESQRMETVFKAAQELYCNIAPSITTNYHSIANEVRLILSADLVAPE